MESITQDPLAFGVGARVTVSVMSDRYVDVILAALDAADSSGLVLETGDVSTYAGGDEQSLLRWLTDLSQHIAATGLHASIQVLLSRGCPGEAVCDLPGGAGPRRVDAPRGRRSGSFASAEWALYPLEDAGSAERTPDHMREIYAAIETAKASGTFVASEHFVTKLSGDLGRVLETVAVAWAGVGAHVQHVTSHLTISLNSPSHARGQADSAIDTAAEARA
ncbi:hypothetical protein C5E07_11175 [Pseudoclavibacter sp. RFBJ3]|uniref:YkoF family thiamine/hydroxymethylpyrimidine-binding protein n=1 Tax=unclassified Pseudoclavibacter TaxID=2615177 RepID=UPI000CE7CA6F|nr:MULTISPECIES: YkoF family thiamine/hydroxymethylpyrimidine-binding protein [unclassified Pseudoclavibacter]PPF84021.1 hypothetical protein C5C12_10255 [Pseudoclavibacter sp. RFBJ5]PPF92301.1 hypothetical protein C5E07_11175 [Pseudoclavibacter sp. RFBJ3]PPF97164.1 hypothetical protein C5C19_14485 [Pseudoclavibacter sp. RFBH5]PPG23851.1 hypothetical protein C5E13_09870 [Pseudoclavibacter sp. RFBI4]